MAHLDDLTAYLVERGENPAEIDPPLVKTALEYGYFHSETRLTEYETLPYNFCIACFGVYKQIKGAGPTGAWHGMDVSTGNYQFKIDNDLPYNSRKIFESYRPRWCF